MDHERHAERRDAGEAAAAEGAAAAERAPCAPPPPSGESALLSGVTVPSSEPSQRIAVVRGCAPLFGLLASPQGCNGNNGERGTATRAGGDAGTVAPSCPREGAADAASAGGGAGGGAAASDGGGAGGGGGASLGSNGA